jgi:hypothetical protein
MCSALLTLVSRKGVLDSAAAYMASINKVQTEVVKLLGFGLARFHSVRQVSVLLSDSDTTFFCACLKLPDDASKQNVLLLSTDNGVPSPQRGPVDVRLSESAMSGEFAGGVCGMMFVLFWVSFRARCSLTRCRADR